MNLKMNLEKSRWCILYTGKEDKLIEFLNRIKYYGIRGDKVGKYYGIDYISGLGGFVPGVDNNPWGKVLTYEQFLNYIDMSEELTIRKDRVLEAAETCSESKEVLKRLFPEVFENYKLNHKVRIGDIFLDENSNTHCSVVNCKNSMEIISIEDCNRLINLNLREQPLTRSDVISRVYGCYDYIGNIYEDNLNLNVKITPKE